MSKKHDKLSRSSQREAVSIYDFTMNLIDGTPLHLATYEGQVLLIVNTASQCGFTPQFKGLEALYQKYHAQGLNILGFPCNQFKHQDPRTDEEIASFCRVEYGVSFPMFSKIKVNGAEAHPLFKHLKKEAKGLFGTETIKWNFTKFLVDADGHVIRRYSSKIKPNAISKDISNCLKS